MNSFLANAAGLIAPYYNLAFVLIVVLLFIKLLRTKNKQVYHKPWYLLFAAVCVFIVEETLTVLNALNLVTFPNWLFGVFEISIITLFIYMLLLQKQYIKTGKRG